MNLRRALDRSWLVLLLALAPAAALHADGVAISSVVFNGYTREQQTDGTFKPEFYTFGEGGSWTRAINDPTVDKLKFVDVARVAAGPLAKMNFRPAFKSTDATLLILVFWGSTQGSSSDDPGQATDRAAAAISAYNRVKPLDSNAAVDANSAEGAEYETALWQLGLANDERDRLDDRNARILGYTEAADRARSATHMSMNRDVLQELRDNRYYIVLKAYDFKTAVKEKKLRPLWVTRMSVSEGGSFSDALAKMVWSAHRYFGRDSNGLKRQREGTVELAPLKVLDVVPDKTDGPDAPDKK